MVERKRSKGRRDVRAGTGQAKSPPAPGGAEAPRVATGGGPGAEDVPAEIVDDELTALTHPAAGEGLVAAPGAPEVAHALARARRASANGCGEKR